MKTFTVADIMDKGPCPACKVAVITELWAGRGSLTFSEICSLDIDVFDRMWVATRLASRDVVVKWAQYCAGEAQKHANSANAAARYANSNAYWANSAASADAAHASAADAADAADITAKK